MQKSRVARGEDVTNLVRFLKWYLGLPFGTRQEEIAYRLKALKRVYRIEGIKFDKVEETLRKL
jgi:hypothetical protein